MTLTWAKERERAREEGKIERMIVAGAGHKKASKSAASDE
jgi:hypothetical protein